MRAYSCQHHLGRSVVTPASFQEAAEKEPKFLSEEVVGRTEEGEIFAPLLHPKPKKTSLDPSKLLLAHIVSHPKPFDKTIDPITLKPHAFKKERTYSRSLPDSNLSYPRKYCMVKRLDFLFKDLVDARFELDKLENSAPYPLVKQQLYHAFATRRKLSDERCFCYLPLWHIRNTWMKETFGLHNACVIHRVSEENKKVQPHEIVRLPDGTLDKIATGAYGIAYRCISRIDGHEYAAKVMSINPSDNFKLIKSVFQSAMKEAFFLSVLSKSREDFPCIQPKGFFFSSPYDPMPFNTFTMISRFARGHTVYEFIYSKLPDSNDKKWLLHIIERLLIALIKLKKIGILHLDIKPSNLILHVVRGLLLCDFGLSAFASKDGTHLLERPVVTAYYRPISCEVVGRASYSDDLISAALTIYEIVCGQPIDTFGDSVDLDLDGIKRRKKHLQRLISLMGDNIPKDVIREGRNTNLFFIPSSSPPCLRPDACLKNQHFNTKREEMVVFRKKAYDRFNLSNRCITALTNWLFGQLTYMPVDVELAFDHFQRKVSPLFPEDKDPKFDERDLDGKFDTPPPL